MKLIDKDALVAEIEEKIMYYEEAFDNPSVESYEAYLIAKGKYRKLLDILQFINALEVKEVDLDNDLFEEVYSHLDDIKDTADRMTSGNFMHHRAAIKFSANVIEKVLGLIGLKAQKGE